MVRLAARSLVALGLGLCLAPAVGAEPAAPGRTFYVRQAAGLDGNDGRTPETAWQSLSPLATRVRAGDVVYVGPGLYRDAVNVTRGGRPDAPLVFMGDASGAATGDAPGPVLIVGSDPVDEARFEPAGAPGVFRLHVPEFPVLGVVEMDGPQHRYAGVLEPIVGPPPLERVETMRASFYYDRETAMLTLHTSDDAPPTAHELELIRRHSGFYVVRQPWVTVGGFHLRSFGDSPISFRWADHGAAIANVAWGSRQGVRVRASEGVLLEGNTLFRNANSGAYFVQGSRGGIAVGNVAYENVKGLRWSSESVGGRALANVLFENREAGLSFERAPGGLARDNRLFANLRTQFMLHETEVVSDANCFALGAGASSIAERWEKKRFPTLAQHRRENGMDRSSRSGSCGPTPRKVDVHEIQRRALAAGAAPPP